MKIYDFQTSCFKVKAEVNVNRLCAHLTTWTNVLQKNKKMTDLFMWLLFSNWLPVITSGFSWTASSTPLPLLAWMTTIGCMGMQNFGCTIVFVYVVRCIWNIYICSFCLCSSFDLSSLPERYWIVLYLYRNSCSLQCVFNCWVKRSLSFTASRRSLSLTNKNCCRCCYSTPAGISFKKL